MKYDVVCVACGTLNADRGRPQRSISHIGDQLAPPCDACTRQLDRADKYAVWFAELRAEFAKAGGSWGLWGLNADPTDSCWRLRFDEGSTPAEVVDDEIGAAGS